MAGHQASGRSSASCRNRNGDTALDGGSRKAGALPGCWSGAGGCLKGEPLLSGAKLGLCVRSRRFVQRGRPSPLQGARQRLGPPHGAYREGRAAAPPRTLPRTVRSWVNCRLSYAPHSMYPAGGELNGWRSQLPMLRTSSRGHPPPRAVPSAHRWRREISSQQCCVSTLLRVGLRQKNRNGPVAKSSA